VVEDDSESGVQVYALLGLTKKHGRSLLFSTSTLYRIILPWTIYKLCTWILYISSIIQHSSTVYKVSEK